ncbi:hypothetical protein HRbin09_01399 [bacterium HR09]|nr:hypothetical protein HRbin09_01399 [bacterium HR09]
MTFFFQGACWYALVFLAGVAGFSLTRRLFSSAFAAWGAARLFGLGASAYVAWFAGLAGLSWWAWISLPLLLVGALYGFPAVRRQLKPIGELELVGLAAFWLLAVLRAPNYAVTGTEKPMDLAILAALMRSQPLPPEDPWFAGHPLPYYFWGFLPWILPAKLSGFFPDQVFNLLVPTLAAATAQLAYGWVRAVGAGQPWGVAAAGSCVFLGTAQGWSELLAGKAGFFTSNLWEASRGIANTITEFPLFTFHLGDLHPHLLCQPWVLLSLLVWELLLPLPSFWKALLCGFAFGIAAASNPWVAPLLGLSIVAMSLATGKKKIQAIPESLGAALLAFILFFPAWKNLPAGASGLGFVHTPTTLGETARVLLPALLPLLAFSVWFFFRRYRHPGLALAVLGFAGLAWLTARPLMALALICGAAVLTYAWRETQARLPALLAVACLISLVGIEVLYVKDPYGPQFYRMNTVFKTLSFIFLVLPVPGLRLLAHARGGGLKTAPLWALLPWLLSLPHLATVVRGAWPPPRSFAGLQWMAPGEAEAAHLLHREFRRDVLVEAVGEAYTDAARMSSCSGVPTVLGWENHEALWRPGSFAPLIASRKSKVQELYRCQDPVCARSLAHELGATVLVVGSVERRLYPELNEKALMAAGSVVFAQGDVSLVRLTPPGE